MNIDLTCEHPVCSKKMIALEESNSTIAVLQKVTSEKYSYFQCEQGAEVNRMRFQHWHCSGHCMREHLATCLQDHYSEEALHDIPPGGGTTTLHTVVLSAGLCCGVCQSPLDSQAYRFCLTRATPYNQTLNDHSELAGWCCSLEHARQAALALI